MRFGLVPDDAKQARPWAKATAIGPPSGLEDQVGFVEAQVDDRTDLGRGFRLFAYAEGDDLERLQNGHPIEFVVYGAFLQPVSVDVTWW